MDIRFGSRALTALVGLATIAAACSSVTGPVDIRRADALEVLSASGIVFMTMNVVPEASMEALFEGTVTTDTNGCLRADTEDRHTIIWPKGYRVESADGGHRVVDRAGETVGRIGGGFRLGGGEVPFLHEGLGFTTQDQALADATCPGRYWIVGE